MTPEELEEHVNTCTVEDCDVCYEYFEGDAEGTEIDEKGEDGGLV